MISPCTLLFLLQDIIGTADIDMWDFFLYAFRKKDRVVLKQNRRHWLTQLKVSSKKIEETQFYLAEFKDELGDPISQGTLNYSMSLMPKKIATDVIQTLTILHIIQLSLLNTIYVQNLSFQKSPPKKG